MTNLTNFFDTLTPIEQNNLIKGYLSDKVASLIHNTLYDTDSLDKAQSEIESIIHSEITKNLSSSAKNYVVTMCNKALEIVQFNR